MSQPTLSLSFSLGHWVISSTLSINSFDFFPEVSSFHYLFLSYSLVLCFFENYLDVCLISDAYFAESEVTCITNLVGI